MVWIAGKTTMKKIYHLLKYLLYILKIKDFIRKDKIQKKSNNLKHLYNEMKKKKHIKTHKQSFLYILLWINLGLGNKQAQ